MTAAVPQQAPAGARLRIATIAATYHITMRDLGRAVGASESTIRRIVNLNAWPRRDDPARIRRAVELLLVDRGFAPDPDNLAAIWQEETLIPHRPRDGAVQQPLNGSPQAAQEPDMLLPKQTLSPAARKAFTLFVNPFDGEVTTDEQMFSNGEIAYVREACLQTALGGRFVAVVSESGGGKTTMLQDLESRIQRDHRPVIVIRPWVLGMEDNDAKGKTLKSTDILASVITTLDQLVTVPQTLQARSNKAKDLLSKSAEAGFQHLLVIEEAHSLPDATLKHLKRLHEMRVGRRPLLGILLLGQTELALKLDPKRASLREVTQRCEVVQLLPLDGDLQAYLEHRAQQAGKPLSAFIDGSGVEEIRRRLTVERGGPGGQRRVSSLLYPLAVNNLVTAALNTAAELGAPLVTRDVVRAI